MAISEYEKNFYASWNENIDSKENYITTGHQYFGIKPSFYRMRGTSRIEVRFENTKGIEVARHTITEQEYKALPFSQQGTAQLVERFNLI